MIRAEDKDGQNDIKEVYFKLFRPDGTQTSTPKNLIYGLSGDLDGTPGVAVLGPKGIVELQSGVIRAAIHVHMNPAEAADYGVSQGESMKLRVMGPSAVVFEGVQVRVDPSSRLNVHMDTDEANACALHLATGFELFKQEGARR
jgi:putative phosphotransacetylase